MPMFKRQAAVLLAMTALALGVVFYLWPDGDPLQSTGKPVTVTGGGVTQTPSAPQDTGSGTTTGPAVSGEKLVVFVTGAVKAPGVYELPGSSRIEDAVKAAGGFGLMADTQRLNLAQPLKDGDSVVVPAAPEGMRDASATAVSGGSGDNSVVRLNTATAAQLETLPGIGPALAGRIIEHRSRHGAFRRIEDIQLVPGIGAGRYEKMKGRLAL